MFMHPIIEKIDILKHVQTIIILLQTVSGPPGHSGAGVLQHVERVREKEQEM